VLQGIDKVQVKCNAFFGVSCLNRLFRICEGFKPFASTGCEGLLTTRHEDRQSGIDRREVSHLLHQVTHTVVEASTEVIGVNCHKTLTQIGSPLGSSMKNSVNQNLLGEVSHLPRPCRQGGIFAA